MIPYFPLVLKNIHLHRRWVCLWQGVLTNVTRSSLAADTEDIGVPLKCGEAAAARRGLLNRKNSLNLELVYRGNPDTEGTA